MSSDHKEPNYFSANKYARVNYLLNEIERLNKKIVRTQREATEKIQLINYIAEREGDEFHKWIQNERARRAYANRQ